MTAEFYDTGMDHCQFFIILQLETACADFSNATFSGVRTQAGAYDPKVKFGRDLCAVHIPQVSSSCVYSFGSYRVDKHTRTNKQTDAAETSNFIATLRRWVINCCGSKVL